MYFWSYNKEFKFQSNWKIVKIFVTGGAGFIGRHLVESLLNEKNKVTIFDNFKNSSKNRIQYLIKNGASLIKGDITDYLTLERCMHGFDAVIHLAAEIDVQESIKSPQLTHQVNVTGTVNLLRSCVAKKVKNIIASSSAAVFGDPTELPLSENSKTIPLSPYGASKLAMEHYMQAFANSFNLNCVSLRFFNVYGNGQSIQYAGVITRFLEKIVKNEPLEVFGDGSSTRDFVSIYDVVGSIKKTLSKIEGKRGNVYNIASGKYITIREIANLMKEISGKNISIEYKDQRKGDILHSQTSVLLARKELGYFPKVRLQDGLAKLLEANHALKD